MTTRYVPFNDGDDWEYDDGRASRPYLSAAERRALAAKSRRELSEAGEVLEPIIIKGRKLSDTFWGKAWCRHIESLSDYSSRLPQGRSDVRHGAVLDLKITSGQIQAIVQGSDLYRVLIKVAPLDRDKWQALGEKCSGQIDSLVALISGQISDAVMSLVSDPQDGIFPKTDELKFSCTCPDWADMCQHIAASLYGVSQRLDVKPDLLFTLRGIAANELVEMASASVGKLMTTDPEGELDDEALGALFGIELADVTKKAPKNDHD